MVDLQLQMKLFDPGKRATGQRHGSSVKVKPFITQGVGWEGVGCVTSDNCSISRCLAMSRKPNFGQIWANLGPTKIWARIFFLKFGLRHFFDLLQSRDPMNGFRGTLRTNERTDRPTADGRKQAWVNL